MGGGETSGTDRSGGSQGVSEGVRNGRVRCALHRVAVEQSALEDRPPVCVLRLREPDVYLALRRLRRVGRVHQIAVREHRAAYVKFIYMYTYLYNTVEHSNMSKWQRARSTGAGAPVDGDGELAADGAGRRLHRVRRAGHHAAHSDHVEAVNDLRSTRQQWRVQYVREEVKR